MEEINATKKMIEEQTTENKQSVSKEQIQSINNFILKGWEELTIKDKEELILSTVDKIEFNFIPKDKKHKTNTLDINNIHFKF
ncbi:recombinase family protein, partial [Staphylococcus lugdunensis]